MTNGFPERRGYEIYFNISSDHNVHSIPYNFDYRNEETDKSVNCNSIGK